MTPPRRKPVSAAGRVPHAAKPAARRRKAAAATAPKPSAGAERPLKIGEAARIIGVEPYVLRFWETQFPFLRPRHSRSKHRYYDQKNLDTLNLVKRLLHGEGYTIAGAKKHIREEGLDRLREPAGDGQRLLPAPPPADPGHELPRATAHKLAAIREELKTICKMLDG
ncbi:MAG: MerR family transcriptional regulator [Candidatus Binataceae bacterium]|nr:MerR family transcriptional regulator [Candidatus Binataceae bacterium]